MVNTAIYVSMHVLQVHNVLLVYPIYSSHYKRHCSQDHSNYCHGERTLHSVAGNRVGNWWWRTCISAEKERERKANI